MRRVLTMAAFGLLLAVPLWAQHGGGGHGGGGGGGHASFGGGHVSSGGGHSSGFSGSHASSPHVSSSPAAHSFHGGPEYSERPNASYASEPRASYGSNVYRPGYSSNFVPLHSARSNFSRGPYLHDGLPGWRFGHFGNNHCFGVPCRGIFVYPWAYGYGYYNPFWYNSFWYDPYWWWDSGSYYDDSDDTTGYYQNVADAAVMNQENYNQQNYEQQQQMFDQERNDGDQDIYLPEQQGGGNSTQASPNTPAGKAIMPATILVFRDQHKEEVQNYAIVGQTLWNFSAQRTQRILLADLDIAATIKANDDNGVTFRVPENDGR